MVSTVPKDGQHSPKRWLTQSQKMVSTVPKDGQHSPKRWSAQSQRWLTHLDWHGEVFWLHSIDCSFDSNCCCLFSVVKNSITTLCFKCKTLHVQTGKTLPFYFRKTGALGSVSFRLKWKDKLARVCFAIGDFSDTYHTRITHNQQIEDDYRKEIIFLLSLLLTYSLYSCFGSLAFTIVCWSFVSTVVDPWYFVGHPWS